jgi:hypothetical protein
MKPPPRPGLGPPGAISGEAVARRLALGRQREVYAVCAKAKVACVTLPTLAELASAVNPTQSGVYAVLAAGRYLRVRVIPHVAG